MNNVYGWDSTIVKTKNGPQVMYSNYDVPLNEMLTLQENGCKPTNR